MRASLIAAVAMAAFVNGCGPSGPVVYHRSGTATFAGQPIPLGKIYFDPDVGAGGSGPSGFADIVDGKFDTASAGGKGSSHGPMTVRVTGYSKDNPDKISGFGRPLFVEHAAKADLPAKASEYTIDVPATAAKGLPKKSVPLDP